MLLNELSFYTAQMPENTVKSERCLCCFANVKICVVTMLELQLCLNTGIPVEKSLSVLFTE